VSRAGAEAVVAAPTNLRRARMRRKLQVFISSTYVDLQEERQAAVAAILEAGHIPTGMEVFPAGDKGQLETIRQWIDGCDVFLLILGGRYGSLDPESGKSYTELEYLHAVEQRKMLHFALVLKESAIEEKVRQHGLQFIERDNPALLKQFKDGVTGKKICRFVEDKKDIRSSILTSLKDFEDRDLRLGWIPAKEVLAVPAAISPFKWAHSAFASMADQIQKKQLTIRKAELVQHSSERAWNLMLALLGEQADIELFVQDPDTVGALSPAHLDRVKTRIEDYPQQLKKHKYRAEFKLRTYRAPASVNGVRLVAADGRKILILGWYAYYHDGVMADLSEGTLGGGENPCVVIDSTHPAFADFEAFFDDFLDSCRTQTRKPILHVKDGNVLG
jgi:hypothetical protein